METVHPLQLLRILVILFIQVDHMQVMVEVKAAVAVPMADHMDITLAEVLGVTQVWVVMEVVETSMEIPRAMANTPLVMAEGAAEAVFEVLTTPVAEEVV